MLNKSFEKVFEVIRNIVIRIYKFEYGVLMSKYGIYYSQVKNNK